MLKELFGLARKPAAPVEPSQARANDTVLDLHDRTRPTPQNAIDIFAGDWVSTFPPDSGLQSNGTVPLFGDSRARWAIGAMGGVQGKRVLELGPLEGAHTTMLEHEGAREIVAIESNRRAFLRCLITKEVMGLSRARFLCGDFLEHLRHTDERFDACFASGVLYHLAIPPELVAHLSRVAGQVFVWTHYYDEALFNAGALARNHVFDSVPATYESFEYRAHLYAYRSALSHANFSGGSTAQVAWMSRDEVLRCFRHFGFGDISIGAEEPDHPHGPAIMFVASKSR